MNMATVTKEKSCLLLVSSQLLLIVTKLTLISEKNTNAKNNAMWMSNLFFIFILFYFF